LETTDPKYKGCFGGDRIRVNPGDEILMIMELPTGTNVWKQTVTVTRNGQAVGTVKFDMDLLGQEQGWAEFVIETVSGWHANPPPFLVKDIVLKASGSDPGFCEHQATVMGNKPGGAVLCSSPVLSLSISESTCTVAKCLFNWYQEGTGSNPANTPPAGNKNATSTSPPVITSTQNTPPPTATRNKCPYSPGLKKRSHLNYNNCD
jgi:hypothetical protein